MNLDRIYKDFKDGDYRFKSYNPYTNKSAPSKGFLVPIADTLLIASKLTTLDFIEALSKLEEIVASTAYDVEADVYLTINAVGDDIHIECMQYFEHASIAAEAALRRRVGYIHVLEDHSFFPLSKTQDCGTEAQKEAHLKQVVDRVAMQIIKLKIKEG